MVVALRVENGGHFLELSSRMYLLLALFNLWLLGLDFVVGELQPQSYAAGVFFVVCVALVFIRNYRLHQAGAVAGWILFVASLGVL